MKIFNKSIFLIILTFHIFSLSSQDSTSVRKWICDLSSDQLMGRGYAYNGDSIAAEYITNQLKKIGVSPVDSDFYQYYSFPIHAIEGPCSFKVDDIELFAKTDYRIVSFSQSLNDSKIPLLHVSPKQFLNQQKLIKDNKLTTKNTIVYLDLTTIDDDTMRKAIFELINKMKAETNNAYNLILGVNELSAWSFEYSWFKHYFSIIYVLADKISNKTKTVSINFKNTFYNSYKTQNIIAKIDGTQYYDSMIMITAHYDHLGMMGSDVLFPGAHDNASGVATVLALAKYLKNNPVNCTIIFCFFSGEEAGLCGSSYFAKRPTIDLGKVKFLLNIDMACGGDDGIMIVNSNADNTKSFFDTFVLTNEKYKLLTKVNGRSNAKNSDHYIFSQKGVPAIFIYTLGGNHGEYHNFSDKCDFCGLYYWERYFKLLINSIESICKN